MQPVILWDDELNNPSKQWVITIHKSLVYEDIDRFTYKHVEGSGSPAVKQRNAVSSDTSEHLDGSVIERYTEFRHAKLCTFLQHSIEAEESTTADDIAPSEQPSFIYTLSIPKETKEALRRPLAEYMHRFLVWGVLYDWYSQFGLSQAGVYEKELNQLEEQIDSIVRGPSIVKRPMQPYGPAEKIY